uniref:Large ribosomal subunit protein uL23c n=1 Tax=Laurencia australis TaxID=3073067 RepID=A0AA51NEX0_9FLOR|nr:50S ribosomal protein L23 [Laurencia australis]WMP12090.1 50S ribosomal protein L23 [Laurencia australis]
MNQQTTISSLIDIIKYPRITDKTTKDIENNVYCFQVDKNSNKIDIKKAIENIFDVKVEKVNTTMSPPKTKTVGKFKGKIKKYKKAIVKLKNSYTINLFESK